MNTKLISLIALLSISISTIAPVSAQTTSGSFSDVSASHPNATAIEYLKNEGIIGGYPDGTFGPENIVNRAEALKIVLEANEKAIQEPTETSFSDVDPSDWFAKYVETAKSLEIVNGNPDGTFAPARTVNKVEFLKMLLLTYEVEFVNYHTPEKPLYPDATDSSQWYIPYLDFAKNLNLVIPNSAGNIEPDKGLTRGEVAEITYKLIIVIKGGPVQLLLSRSESLMMQAIFNLQEGNLEEASANIKSAKELANEALTQAPEESIVKAAVKIIEAFETLIQAFQHSANSEDDEALAASGQAYNKAEEAKQIDAGIESLSDQVKSAAKSLADSIRAKQNQ